MTSTITVNCPREECGMEIELECEIEPGEMYGMDADGNRGVWVPEGLLPPDTPTGCKECGATYTSEEITKLDKEITCKAQDYTPTESCREPEDFEDR